MQEADIGRPPLEFEYQRQVLSEPHPLPRRHQHFFWLSATCNHSGIKKGVRGHDESGGITAGELA